MYVRCDNQYKTGADGGIIFGKPMLFVCMGTCVLSPAHESEMRGYLVYVLIVKNLPHRFCLNSATDMLDWTVFSWNFWRVFFFFKHF